MSRPHRASTHSRGNSPFRDRSLSTTETTFQGLHLNETARSQHLSIPSPYQTSDPCYRHSLYPRSELSSSYLESGFDPSTCTRTPSSGSFIDPIRANPTPIFEGLDSNPLDYQIDPNTADFQDSSDPTVLPRTDMRYVNVHLHRTPMLTG